MGERDEGTERRRTLAGAQQVCARAAQQRMAHQNPAWMSTIAPYDRAVGERPPFFGLQVKFTVLVVGMALAMGALVGGITFDFSSRMIRRAHADNCRQTADLLALRAATEYGAYHTRLAALAEEVVRSDTLLFVSFMDAQGRNLCFRQNTMHPRMPRLASGFTPYTTIGTPTFIDAEKGQLPHLDVTYPVRRAVPAEGDGRSELLGYVRLGMSLERTIAEVNATVELLTGIAVVLGALTVPLGFLLVRRLVGPLRDLSRTMTRFADGDLAARSPVQRRDEIGELAIAYNVMADRLAQKHQEISELNAELEERVQQRTRQLRELAVRDPLTGLYNRRHFDEVLQRRFAEAKRYNTELSCMMLDLDNFKAVNDHHGHQAGDELLILTAITITRELRSSDVAARFGGDEFVVLLPQTGTADAQVQATRIMRRLDEAMLEQGLGNLVTVSVGVACMVDVASRDPESLIRVADRALYEAKTRGKNTVVAHELTT